MNETTFAARASALLERSIDRGRSSGALAPGRILLPLFALHHLSQYVGKGAEDPWQHVRNRVVHARGPADSAERCLTELAAAVERKMPGLEKVFTAGFLPDLAPFEAMLPFWITALDQLGRPDAAGQEGKSFALWFDETLDDLAMRSTVGVQQWATPRRLAELAVSLLQPEPQERITDVCHGLGAMLAATVRTTMHSPGERYSGTLSGQEIDRSIAQLAKLRLFLLTGDASQLHVGDALRRPREMAEGGLIRYDVVFAHPPFGQRLAERDFAEQDPYGRFRWGRVGRSTAELAFAQHAIASLEPCGRAAILLPPGPLSRAGSDAGVREALVREDMIEAVLGLPAGLLPGLSSEIALVVINLAKRPDRRGNVLFIDASGERAATARDPSAWRRLADEIVNTHRGTTPGLGHSCALVTARSIEQNDFSLRPRAYIARLSSPPPHGHREVGVPQLSADALSFEEKARMLASEMDRRVADYLANAANHARSQRTNIGARSGNDRRSRP